VTAAQPLVRTRVFAGGERESLPAQAAAEAEVQLNVNGEAWLGFHCSPVDLEALGVGFLFNEGFIETAGEVASLRVCDAGDQIDVWLAHAVEKPQQWSRTSGCQGGVVRPGAPSTGAVRSTMVVSGEALFARVDAFLTSLAAQDGHSQGLHTSMLFEQDEVRWVSRDIGRHNTLDKIAGASVLGGRRLHEPSLITTGRISEEMVAKAARMGIPLVMSLHSASDRAVEAADRLEITLVGHARRSQMDVYAHPERILFEKKQNTRLNVD